MEELLREYVPIVVFIGIALVIGLALLIYRRLVVKSVRVATTRMDIVTYVMLSVSVALGAVATVVNQLLGGHDGYDYRETISPWFRTTRQGSR